VRAAFYASTDRRGENRSHVGSREARQLDPSMYRSVGESGSNPSTEANAKPYRMGSRALAGTGPAA
jgi:hypothetical protein